MFQILNLTKNFKEMNQQYIPKTNSKCNDKKHENTLYS
jgi:hypothetical protein